MSEFLHKVTGYMRRIDGTPAEPLRNGLLVLVGSIADLVYWIRRRGRDGIEHPLAELVSRQVGEPRDRWDLTDLDALRAKSAGLMAYLPSRIRSTSYTERLGGVNGVDAIRLRPRKGASAPDAAVVYLHGGGFVLGDATSVLPEADVLSDRLRVDVYVIEYPLSPTSIYPEALDRVAAGLRDLTDRHRRLVLVGESAGANVAVSAELRHPRLRENVVGLVLLYGWMDLRLTSNSIRRLGRGHVLTSAILHWFADQYTGGDQALRSNPEVTPLLHLELSELPPSLCIVGEFDPLIDDMVSVAKAIPNSELRVVRGMVHGFLQFRTIYRQRLRVLSAVSAFIRRQLDDGDGNAIGK
ncbi:alpha/beta hydrolase fold domain-containing protein [Microbacterium sp.]|uniref:alpha/beta hydrolase fold domain-containing protein n=1 Tax=Microbacterium sp. TaxID=51671 RepID=UPI003C146DF0